MRLLPAVLFLIATSVGAQTIGQNKQPGSADTYTLTVKAQLVVETVVVKDKKGNPIHGLTAKDFTVTEDGVQQTIRFCEHQELPKTPDALPATPRGDEDIHIY